MLDSLKEISIMELWSLGTLRRLSSLQPCLQAQLQQSYHECISIYVYRSYLIITHDNFHLHVIKKIPLIQQLVSLFQAAFDKAKLQQNTF